MTKITRRQAMKTTLAGAALAVVGAPVASASALRPDHANATSKCATMHPLIGQNLAMYCDDTTVSSTAKTMALKSTRCPHCDVAIAPFGESVNFVRL